MAASLISPSLDTSPVSHPIRRERIRDTPISANCPLRRMTGANEVVELHRSRVEGGGFGLERIHVAPCQAQRSAGLLDRYAGAVGVADPERGFRARNRGGLGVGADDAHRRQQQAEFATAVVIYPSRVGGA